MTVSGKRESNLPAPPASTPDDRPSDDKKTISQVLVELALSNCRFGRTAQGRPFAVERDGPNIALPMMSTKNGRFRTTLAAEYYSLCKRPPNAAALADAEAVLIGRALEEDPEEVWIRTGRAPNGSIVLDLGDESGRAVVVTPDGWKVVEKSPILFRRTNLTVAWPEPSRGGGIEKLRPFINTTDPTFDLLVAAIVSSYIPDIPHVVILLSGEHGSVKSSACRAIMNLIDPTSAILRKAPKDAEAWSVAAAGSWGVALDNLSNIPEWLSDAICRAATGDADVRRKLYEDDALFVEAFRRVVVLNGIEVGGVRGDLIDRTLLVECGHLEGRRREEAEVNANFASAWSELLGAALDLLSDCLAAQRDGTNQVDDLPRMADFARVVRAVDLARETDALYTYRKQQTQNAIDVAEDDVLTGPLRAYLLMYKGRFEGTADELLHSLDMNSFGRTPNGWPRSAKVLAGRLARLAPGLRAAGWTMEKRRSNGRKLWKIALPPERPRRSRRRSVARGEARFRVVGESHGGGRGSQSSGGGSQ
jgi:hypothetical protein